MCALIWLPLALVVRPYVCGGVFLLCLVGWKRSIGEWCCVRCAFVNLVAYTLVGWFCRTLRKLPPSLISNLLHHHQRNLHHFSHDKVYSTLKTDTMTSALSDNFPPGETLETATRTALAEEEELYQNLNDRKLARKRKLNHTRSSIAWLGSARGAARVVFDSSADVISVLRSFVDNLSSVISTHESDQISGDLKQSLPSIDAAKQSWELVADVIENLLVQIESLKSATLCHSGCMARELGAHKSVEQQSQKFVDSLTQRIDALTHSITQKRTILHPIRRVPTEILEQIFESATLDERLTLRGNLCWKSTSDKELSGCHSIPRIPTILASTCRRWRMIALNMAWLWSFLCVPTSVNCTSTGSRRTFVVGLSTFQQAKSCIGASECELVVGPTIDWGMVTEHLRSIPASQISTMNIVSPPDWLDFSQFPTTSILRIFRGHYRSIESSVRQPSVSLPTSLLARTRELKCHNVLPAVDEPILSVTSFSLDLHSTRFPHLGLFLARVPNLTTLILSMLLSRPGPQITPLHHARVRTLSITGGVITYLCASLQRGALSLPSLTHFILLFPPSSKDNEDGECGQLKSLLINVTRFDIREASQRSGRYAIRDLLDAMPLLQQFTLYDTALTSGLGALLLAPMKRIGKLIIAESKTDGTNVKSYYDALRSGSVDRPDDNLDISIQFMNCPYILPQIREQLSS